MALEDATIDILIIGSGAAGSVLANRLSACGTHRVVLLEAGDDVTPGSEPADIRNIFPLASFNRRYMWPDTLVHWRNRHNSSRVPLPQGRILGGSSTVMGMWALRGHPDDYDSWERAGAAGWDWASVRPYFKRLETDHDFAGPDHGDAGPIPIRREHSGRRVPLARALYDIARRRGWADIADMNADFRDGHCTLPVSRTIDARASAGICYLTQSVRERRNLQVLTGHEATALLMDNDRVVGATVRRGDGTYILRAKLVIVACGALRSPVLLLRSGIGPAEQLQRAGIGVVRHLPGVGRNLQNHALLNIVGILTAAGRDPPGFRPAGSTCLRWTSDLSAAPPADMSLAVRSFTGWHALGRRMGALIPCLMRPLSTGQVEIDSEGMPVIEFNLLSDPRDLERMKAALHLTLSLFYELAAMGMISPPMVMGDAPRLMRYSQLSQLNRLRASAAAAVLTVAPALGRFALKRLAKLTPAAEVVRDEAALTDYLLHAVTGAGHVCGTCRMGRRDDPMAVLDSSGNVHGIGGLIVADASVMPNVPSANTHLPTVMVAEKIAAGLTSQT